MHIKDELYWLWAKAINKPTLLFSEKKQWQKSIKQQVNDYACFFYPLKGVNIECFSLVLPLTLAAQRELNKKDYQHVPAIVPSNNCIDLCDDKYLFNLFLIDSGFSRFAPKVDGNLAPPYVLKSKTGEWGDNVFVIKNISDKKAYAVEDKSDNFFKQEYIEGKEEYAAHILFVNPKIVFFKVV